MEEIAMQNLFLNVYCSAQRWFDSNRVSWFSKTTKVKEQRAFHDLIAAEVMDGTLVPATSPEMRNDPDARVYVTMTQLEALEVPKCKKGQYHVLLLECPLYVTDGNRVREDETPLERKIRERRAKKAEAEENGALFSL
jgi:agmatine/peptidylarginine deiminase